MMMLEIIEQMESGEKISVINALGELIGIDLVRIIPTAVIWSVLWFFILLLRALTMKSRRDRISEPSLRDAARFLADAENRPFSIFKLRLKMIEGLLRLVVFLALPAIAWENMGPFTAFGKAYEIVNKHPAEFLTGTTMMSVAAFLMAVPLVIILILEICGVGFSYLFWTVVLVYQSIVWILGVYMEQMYTGFLYLRHLKWEKNGAVGELTSVPGPSTRDELYELL